MTIAQVQGTVSFVLVSFFTWAGLLLAVGLLLPQHAQRAEYRLNTKPIASFFVGVLMIIAFIASGALFAVPNPIGKLIGFIGLVGIATMMVIGASGLSRLMATRMIVESTNMSRFDAFFRSSIIFSLANSFPIIGWFVFMPVAIAVSCGAGLAAVWPSRVRASVAATTEGF
jgi:hypothetical protein